MAVGPYVNPGTVPNKPAPSKSGGYWTNTATGRVWIAPGGRVGKVQPGVGALTGVVTDANKIIHNAQMESPKFRITAMQRFLKNRGYDITVDGVRGPETNAAVTAFHNHIKPNVWNNRSTGVNNGGTGGTTTGPNPDPTAAATAALTGGGPGVPNIPLINPQQYATAAANEQYGPQIAALLQQSKDSKTRYAQNDTDIRSWYQQLMGDVNKYTAQDTAASNAALSGADAANANTLQLFGGPQANDAADEAAAFQGIDRTALASMGVAQGAYDRQIGASDALAGVQARTANRRAGTTDAADLASQLMALRGAKGQAYNSNLYSGLQAQTQQASAIQAMKLASQLAPAQQAAALANAQGAITTAAGAPAAQKAALKAQQLQNQQLQKQLTLMSSTGWNLQHDVGQRNQVTSGVRSLVQTPNGTFKLAPDVTWKNLQGALASQGLSSDPAAQAIAASIMSETVRNSHAKRMWGMYNFDPKTGKVVKNGTPFPKKKK